MSYEKHCWKLLVLGLIFSFVLGGMSVGLVCAFQSSYTIKSSETTTVNGKKLEYWECTDQATSTDFLITKLGDKELIIDLVDFDGKPKAKLSTKSNGVSIVETTSQYYILEDNDTDVQYMISHDFNSYRIRTLETGMPYCNKDV